MNPGSASFRWRRPSTAPPQIRQIENKRNLEESGRWLDCQSEQDCGHHVACQQGPAQSFVKRRDRHQPCDRQPLQGLYVIPESQADEEWARYHECAAQNRRPRAAEDFLETTQQEEGREQLGRESEKEEPTLHRVDRATERDKELPEPCNGDGSVIARREQLQHPQAGRPNQGVVEV